MVKVAKHYLLQVDSGETSLMDLLIKIAVVRGEAFQALSRWRCEAMYFRKLF